MNNKIEVLATTRVQYSSDLYKIVDSSNCTLKEFGLTLDERKQDTAIFTIYRT